MPDEICKHDMIKAWCADCRDKSYTPAKPTPDPKSVEAKDGSELRVIEAVYNGTCWACTGRIQVGDRIANLDTEWVHEDCAT